MKDHEKTKEQLLKELDQIRDENSKLKKSGAENIQAKEQLDAIYQNAPSIMILVDEERRVKKVNGATVQFTDSLEEEMLGLRGGEALRCLHHLDDPKGCGFGPACQSCVIKNSVLDTFKTGKDNLQKEAKLPFLIEGKKQELTLIVSTVLLKHAREPIALVTIEDITERKQAEEASLKSETRLKEAQRIAKIGSWELDLITNTLYWSDEVYRLFDLKPQQFIATYEAFLDNIHPDDREIVNKAYTESLKNKTPYDITHRLQLKSGEIKFVHEFCKTYYDDTGNAVRSIGTVQDITELKQTEDALVKTDSMLASVINSPANVIIFALDTNFNYLSFNNAHVKEMKSIYDADIKIGKLIIEYIPNDDDRLKVVKNYKRVLKGERFIETQQYGLSNSRLWYELIFNPIIDISNNVTGLTVFITNITERKLAEEKLIFQSEILSNMTEAVYLIRSSDGIIEYTNEEFEKMFGYSKNELIGKHISIVNAPTDKSPKETTEQIMVVLAKTGKWEGEIYNIKKDGTQFWCSARISVFDHPQYGKVLVSVHRDISKRKLAEEELKQSEEERNIWIESSPLCTKVVGLDFNLQYMSSAGAKILNIEVLSKVYGKPYPFYFFPESFKTLMIKNMKDAIKTGKNQTLESQANSKKGKKIWLDSLICPIKDEHGATKYLLISTQDTTERMQAEIELKNHREHLEELVEERTTALEEKNKKLDDAMKVFVGREQKIKQLQDKIKAMEQK